MAGKIIADTLEHSTAGSIATSYVVNGSAKMWHNIAGSGTVTTADSFNVSSVSDMATGGYKSNLTNSMSNSDYAAGGNGPNQTDVGHTSIATSHYQTALRNSSDSDFDADDCCHIIHGDLA